MTTPSKVGIFYHADPLGHVPSGIDTFIRSLIKWAPPDIHFTLFGASSDPHARPLGVEIPLTFGPTPASYIPLISSVASARRTRVPLTLQHMWALRSWIKLPAVRSLHVLDFHRIEPVLLFWGDPRPKNVFIHNDMASARDKNSDMRWRHAPWLYEAVEGRILSRVSQVLAVRQTAVDRYRETYPQWASRFTFTPTAVDSDTFRPAAEDQRAALRQTLRKRLGVSVESQLLVFVGRLDSQKDPVLLLQAFAIRASVMPQLHLAMIGDGSLRTAIESAIDNLNLKGRVSLLGAQPSAEISKVLQASELFVLSSAYEGMPIAVLEALTSGVPVVSTDVGEVGVLVRNGVNGYLSDDRTPQSLSKAIEQALGNLAAISGSPCVMSVEPYRPEQVFGAIYKRYRAEASGAQGAGSRLDQSDGALP